jgi:aspartate/methionine/tyrosine aminotransferase
MRFAKRLDNFQEYFFSQLAQKKKEIEKKAGRKVLDLSIGSPTFPPSLIYLEKFKQFIDEKNSHLYPGYRAIPEFAAALILWYKKRFGVELNEKQLLPLLGGKDGVSHLALVFLDNDDEVLVPDPGYPGFVGPALMVGAKPVYYDLCEENNFQIDLKELEKKISKRTKFIWVNFPHNPTGQVIKLEDLKKIVRFCKEYGIWLIYDNAYSEITFDGYVAPSILQVEGAIEIAAEIGSFSKTFSFAGYRMGWIVGNEKIIDALAKVKSQFDSGMPLPFQKLGAYALTNFDWNWYKKMINEYARRRDLLIKYLKKFCLVAKKNLGSLYLWAKIPKSYKDSLEFSFSLLEEKQILLTTGSAFGQNGKDYVRISISSDINEIDQYF